MILIHYQHKINGTYEEDLLCSSKVGYNFILKNIFGAHILQAI